MDGLSANWDISPKRTRMPMNLYFKCNITALRYTSSKKLTFQRYRMKEVFLGYLNIELYWLEHNPAIGTILSLAEVQSSNPGGGTNARGVTEGVCVVQTVWKSHRRAGEAWISANVSKFSLVFVSYNHLFSLKALLNPSHPLSPYSGHTCTHSHIHTKGEKTNLVSCNRRMKKCML